jgi:hypothetical protein
MELFTNFSFSLWTFGYHEAFHTNFSFSRWNSGYQGAFHMNFSFSRWNSGYEGTFHTIKFRKCMIWGKIAFIYITKSIYTGPTSLKTLPLDLEPPLQGKEYGPPYCNEIAEKKANVFVPPIAYRFVTRILFFWNVNLLKKKIL